MITTSELPPSANNALPKTPWNLTPTESTRLALGYRDVINRSTGWRPGLSLTLTDGRKSVTFPANDLEGVLNRHPQVTWIIFDLPALRNRLCQVLGAAADPAVESLGALVDEDKITDARTLFALYLIAHQGEVESKATELGALLTYSRLMANGENGADFPAEELTADILVRVERENEIKETIDLLKKVERLEGSLKNELGATAGWENPRYGLATHNLQVKAAWVLSQMSQEGVGFDREAHLSLLTGNWAVVCQCFAEAKRSFPGHWRSLPSMPLEFFNEGGLFWPNLIVTAINEELTREGARIWLKECDLKQDILLEAAGISGLADAVLSLRHAVQEYNNCVPGLQKHGNRIRSKYHPLVSTGRVSSSEPNIQGFSTKSGVRNCIVASPGNLFLALDYQQMELNTTAVICERTGRGNQMAEALRKGMKLHDLTASHIMSLGYEEFLELKERDPVLYAQVRGCAKAVNFGVAAGMGAPTLVESVWDSLGVQITVEEARNLIEAHRRAFPDVAAHVEFCKGAFSRHPEPLLLRTLTGRTRTCTKYTDALITQSQGLGADGALTALYRLWKAGFKVRIFVHDEVVLEVPEDKVSEAVALAKDIMAKAMAEVLETDIPIGVDLAVGRSWGGVEAV